MLKLSDLKLQKKGLTFLEMIISIGIFVLVATATSAVFNQALHAYRDSVSRMTAVREAELAMSWIVREIQPQPSTCISYVFTAFNGDTTNGDITLQRSGDTVRFFREAASSTIKMQPQAQTAQLLATNVTRLSFRCYDANSQVVNFPTVNYSSIRSVEVNIITNKNAQVFHLQSVVEYAPAP